MPKFKIGDVVVCKLGGPNMVVCEVYDYTHINGSINYGCQWFNRQDSLCDGLFKEDLLEVIA